MKLRNGCGLYRARDGMLFGVCKGVARCLDISPGGVRAAVVLLALFGWILPVLFLYVLVALLLKPEPVVPLRNDAEREFYASWSMDRRLAAQRLKRKCEQLNQRLARMEHIVTSPEFRWDRRMRS